MASNTLSVTETKVFPRRSSVVVIPPMQVCPGDLLVYSKALTHRGNYNGKQSVIIPEVRVKQILHQK